jgi:hypothetical protein
MRSLAAFIVSGVASFLVVGRFQAAGESPVWAYAIPLPPPPGSPAAADTSVKQLPGSPLSFTRQQISDGSGPADWFPGDHPVMPDVVAHSTRPEVRACSLCPYPNGKGRQEDAGISGLPISSLMPTPIRRP